MLKVLLRFAIAGWLIYLLTGCIAGQSNEIVIFSVGGSPAGWRSNSSDLLVSRYGDEPLKIVSIRNGSIEYKQSPWSFPTKGLGCLYWSPNGSSLLFTKVRNETLTPVDLFQANTPESSSILITSTYSIGCPSWSPDGQYYAATMRTSDDSQWVLRLFNKDTRRAEDLFVSATGFGYDVPDLAWSPDGKIIAWSDGYIDIQSKKVRAFPASRDQLTWSPNSQYLAYIGNFRVTQYAGSLLVSNIDGSQTYTLASEDSGYSYRSPMWSPNGDYIAVVRGIMAQEPAMFHSDQLVIIRVPEDLRQVATK